MTHRQRSNSILTATCMSLSHSSSSISGSSMMTPSNGNIFPRDWPFVWGIHRSPVNSPHKGQWRGALIFSLIINNWVNKREAGDLRRYGAHYDVIVMPSSLVQSTWLRNFTGYLENQRHHIHQIGMKGNGVRILGENCAWPRPQYISMVEHVLSQWEKTLHR